MKPPEEVKIPGGTLRIIDTYFVLESLYLRGCYECIPDSPMPELKAGMWVRGIGYPEGPYLVVQVGKYHDVTIFEPVSHQLLGFANSEITAVYDRGEKEIWRR